MSLIPDVTTGRPKRRKRRREYVLYSRDRFALDLTNRYAEHLYGLHRWAFTISACSIRQAYRLAHDYVWASGPAQVGIRRIELAHRFREEGRSEHEAREAGAIREAPYLYQR